MAVAKEDVKQRSFAKILSIILIAFISLPLMTMTLMYFSNDGFRDNANKVLSGLPGRLGNYFGSAPTKEEREEIKKNIARYYIDLDQNRIVDKLLIIKGEDQQLYNDLIILMSKENPNKMKNVKEVLKRQDLKMDPINRILSEIDQDREEKINSLSKYYTSLPLAKAVSEIERTYASNEATLDELVIVFENFKADQASKYLFYLDTEIGRQIKYRMSKESLRDVEKKLQEFVANQGLLYDLALEYENKVLDEAILELGNLNTYSIEELAFIFKELSLAKASKILSKVDDNDFMLTLFQEINHLQELENQVPSISPAIMKGITLYKDYDKKINELSSIYEKTASAELAKMLETMLKRNDIYQRHSLSDSEEIKFSEEQLVIDVLNNLKPKKVAEVLENMEEGTRIILSKKLLNLNI